MAQEEPKKDGGMHPIKDLQARNGNAHKSTDKLSEWDSDKGEGGQNFVAVINGSPFIRDFLPLLL